MLHIYTGAIDDRINNKNYRIKCPIYLHLDARFISLRGPSAGIFSNEQQPGYLLFVKDQEWLTFETLRGNIKGSVEINENMLVSTSVYDRKDKRFINHMHMSTIAMIDRLRAKL